MNPVIRVEGLSKRFPIGDVRRGWMGRARPGDDSFLALDRVSFEAHRGEAVGVVGRNGAGKSSLLKILARILRPTAGRAELHGHVGSLLEVGMGFHPELSGRENIFLSAAMLGMKDREIVCRFDAIVEFSGVEKFLETPVKHYSSGMYMRLAFSVAAHLEPEILLVDEVLAVGDLEFQKKCMQRLSHLGATGQTVLFVSHNLQAVARLCTRALWIDGGKLLMDGPVAEVSAAYLKQGSFHPGEQEWPDGPHAPGDGAARLRRVRVLDPRGAPAASINIGEDFTIEFVYEIASAELALFPAIRIFDEWGTEIVWSTDAGAPGHGKPRAPGLYCCSIRVPRNLLPEGFLAVGVSVTSLAPKRVHFDEPGAVHFQATEAVDGTTSRGLFTADIGSVMRPHLEWTVHKSDRSHGA